MEPSPTTIAYLQLAQMSRPCFPPSLPRQLGECHRTRLGQRQPSLEHRGWDKVIREPCLWVLPCYGGQVGSTSVTWPWNWHLAQILVRAPLKHLSCLLSLLFKATSLMCLPQTPRAWSSMSTWTGQGSTGQHGASFLDIDFQLWSLVSSPGSLSGCSPDN